MFSFDCLIIVLSGFWSIKLPKNRAGNSLKHFQRNPQITSLQTSLKTKCGTLFDLNIGIIKMRISSFKKMSILAIAFNHSFIEWAKTDFVVCINIIIKYVTMLTYLQVHKPFADTLKTKYFHCPLWFMQKMTSGLLTYENDVQVSPHTRLTSLLIQTWWPHPEADQWRKIQPISSRECSIWHSFCSFSYLQLY